jgi:hypothetical protein
MSPLNQKPVAGLSTRVVDDKGRYHSRFADQSGLDESVGDYSLIVRCKSAGASPGDSRILMAGYPAARINTTSD